MRLSALPAPPCTPNRLAHLGGICTISLSRARVSSCQPARHLRPARRSGIVNITYRACATLRAALASPRPVCPPRCLTLPRLAKSRVPTFDHIWQAGYEALIADLDALGPQTAKSLAAKAYGLVNCGASPFEIVPTYNVRSCGRPTFSLPFTSLHFTYHVRSGSLRLRTTRTSSAGLSS